MQMFREVADIPVSYTHLEEKDSTMDIQHFISLIRKYKNPTEVSDLMFTELIDKIVVYEACLLYTSRCV